MTSSPIAILGLACEFPGSSTPEALWQTALRKHRWFRKIPTERLPDEYMDLPGNGPDTTLVRRAAVLEGYRIPYDRLLIGEKDIHTADLAHWLALDCAMRAIEDAGLGPHLPRDSTCVIVGNCLTGETSRAESLRLRWPYVRKALKESGLSGTDDEWRHREQHYKARFAKVESRTLAGALANVIAGRITHRHDLKGGCYSVDAACASSLVAVAQGASMLASGEVDCAVVGGVDVSLDPLELVGFSKAGALSGGEMKIFDVDRSGFLPGEGCGFAVLMRADHPAVRHAPRIRGYIRGWAASSDGQHDLTAPRPVGQRLVLERAYRRAGFGIETVPLFEAHGTGTDVGDRVEAETLLGLLAGSTHAAAIGSIKANIGHTKAAAGIAGMIKATLALEAQILPPTTGCDTPMDTLRNAKALRILNEAEEWPEGQPARAGVSAFGFGGVNAHLVLEGAPSASARSRRNIPVATRHGAEIFFFEGATVEALEAGLSRVRAFAPMLAQAQLAPLACATAQAIAGTEGWRTAILARSADELSARIDRAIQHLRTGPDVELLADPIFVGRVMRADEASEAEDSSTCSSPAEAFVKGALREPATVGAGRDLPPFDLNWKPRYFVNPCERPLPEKESPKRQQPPAQKPATALEAVNRVLRERKGEGFALDEVHDKDPSLSSLGVDSLSIFDLVAAVEGYGYKERELAHNLMTVSQFAAIFDEIEAAGTSPAPAALSFSDRLASWVRAFDVAWEAAPALRAGADVASAQALVVRCNAAIEPSELNALLTALRAGPPKQPVAFLDSTGQWCGFAKTLAIEQPHRRVLYLHHHAGSPPSATQIEAELREPFTFREVQYTADGERLLPRVVLTDPLHAIGSIPLGPEDVVLVTGGAKGITAECVHALASVTGVRLALTGRSLQSESVDVQHTLERLRQHNIVHQYWAADIADERSTAQLIEDVENKLGVITAIIHGAGVNEPCDIASLTERVVRTHTLAKVDGFRQILNAVRPGRLKLVIAFGSVIARSGYPYEAAYALANDCLAYQLSVYQRQHPQIRCQVLDWTVWSETGMGSAMHAIESLKRNGVDPLSNEAGRHAFLSVLGNSDADFRPIVAGRLPQSEAFLFARQTPRIDGWPDAEVTTFIPGVEIVAKVALSLEKLPWLEGHTSRDGVLILPGILAMELMESVALALSPGTPFPCLKDVQFERLVRVSTVTAFDVCIQAIMQADGAILCRLAEDNSAHADLIASMLCVRSAERTPPVAAAKPATRLMEPAGRLLAEEVYEHLLFHRKAFQIINNYSFADATRAVFHVSSDSEGSSTLQKTTTLHDAFLHGVQVCVPRELLLPVRIGTLLRRRPTGFTSCTVDAREISFTPEAYYYHIAAYDETGAMLEEWKDVEFRCYGANTNTASLPDSLASIMRERERAAEVRSSGYFEYRHTVGFKETNVAGNVYYTNHIEWQGRCREMFLKAHAPDVLHELESGQLALVTVSCSCEYEAELRAFDEVSVRMRMDALGNDWVTMSFEYWCAQSLTEVRIAKGLQKIAARRRTPHGLKPTHLPESMVIAFKAYGNDVG